jgi:hypothetical protein
MGGRNNLIKEVKDKMQDILDEALEVSYMGGTVNNLNLYIPIKYYGDIEEELNEKDTDDIVILKGTLREDYEYIRQYKMSLYTDIYGNHDE